jgi:hypothetical protein
MTVINPAKVGFVLGALIGGGHLLWALVVALGWAQWVIDLAFWIYFLKPIYVVAPFNLGVALVLIVVTSVVGFVVGYIFGVIWNRVRL